MSLSVQQAFRKIPLDPSKVIRCKSSMKYGIPNCLSRILNPFETVPSQPVKIRMTLTEQVPNSFDFLFQGTVIIGLLSFLANYSGVGWAGNINYNARFMFLILEHNIGLVVFNVMV